MMIRPNSKSFQESSMAALLLFGDQFHGSPHLLRGWSNPERGYVWSEAASALLRLPKLPAARALLVRLAGDAFTAPMLDGQRILVSHAGRLLWSEVLRGLQVIELCFDVEPSAEEFIDLDLTFPDALSPEQAGTGTDVRRLGFAIQWASVQETAFAEICLADMNLFPAAGLSASDRAKVVARREADVPMVNRICDCFESGDASLADLIDAYIAGAGSEVQVRLRLVGLANRAPEFAGKGNAFSDLCVVRERVANLEPKLLGWLPDPATSPVLVEHLWPESPNELQQRSFPFYFAGTLLSERIENFSIKSSRSMAVSASTYRFVLHEPQGNAIYLPNVSQGSSTIAIEGPEVTVSGRVIVLADRFDGGNIAHFIFDSVTRMLHFIGLHGYRPTDLFYFGGVPLAFHDLVLEAIGAEHGIATKSFFFPKSPVRLIPSDGLYWFNDQEAYRHPAQLMHPKSREIFRRLGELIGSQPNGRKLYLSRSDASLRRIINEAELADMLARHGYEFIRLSDHDYRSQIEIVSGAAAVVAPHGMGMTHLIFNRHRPRVVEIFNPAMGSNAYAWMAYALGFDYTPVAGTEVDAVKLDYSVDTSVIEALID